ncbi:uncharacterized protein [Vulpes vulpes]|uniref:Uncharacterized protein n=1 Tax=Vulpes vulpes TaxID=9627 RepID=A0ABM4YZP1_VULVU
MPRWFPPPHVLPHVSSPPSPAGSPPATWSLHQQAPWPQPRRWALLPSKHRPAGHLAPGAVSGPPDLARLCPVPHAPAHFCVQLPAGSLLVPRHGPRGDKALPPCTTPRPCSIQGDGLDCWPRAGTAVHTRAGKQVGPHGGQTHCDVTVRAGDHLPRPQDPVPSTRPHMLTGAASPEVQGDTNRASGRDSGERRMGPTRRNGPQTPAPAGRCHLKGAGDSAGLRRAGGRAGLGHRSHGLVALHTRSAASSHRPGCGPISPAGHVLGPSWPGALPPLLSPTSSLCSWCRAKATAGTPPRAAGFPQMAQAPGLHCPLPEPQTLRLSEQSSPQGPGGGAAWC